MESWKYWGISYFRPMIYVTIIGTGNVSYHLQRAFSKAAGVCLESVISARDMERLALLREKTTNQKGSIESTQSRVYLIAVSDGAIAEVAQRLKGVDGIIAHTSGNTPLAVLPEDSRRGVFYPLQTFSKNSVISFKKVPLCIEAGRKHDLKVLKELARQISGTVRTLNSEERKILHLAAVFVNNFTNHLYQVGAEICTENKVSFDLLRPLIKETAKKIESLAPFAAQTGPASRNDQQTIENHLGLLKNQHHKDIYKILTQSIANTHAKKL